MAKIKCYSVRLQSLTPVSDKCYKARDFNGNEDFIPKSHVFGQDWDVQKSDAWWISAWILEKKTITYSEKKEGWWNPDKRTVEPKVTIIIEHHVPEKIAPVENNYIPELKK